MTNGVSTVDAEQRVGGEGVRAEPVDVAERRLRAADERLRVRRRRDVDVATLAIGDHEQPGLTSMLDGRAQRRPAVRAEALEARELRLDGHAGRIGVDQRDAVRRDGRRLRAWPVHRRA